MTKYVIHKKSRAPEAWGSYCGLTWDDAGIWHRHKNFYTDKAEAEELAALLSRRNPVGFMVSEAPPRRTEADDDDASKAKSGVGRGE